MKFSSDIISLLFSLNETQREELSNLISKWKNEGLSNIGEYSDSFNIDEVKEHITSINDSERKRKLVDEAISKGETTIPKYKWGVHKTHCCVKHGCKYGDLDCPVELAFIEQDYDCEDCEDDNLFEQFNVKTIKRKDIYKKKLRNLKIKSLIE